MNKFFKWVFGDTTDSYLRFFVVILIGLSIGFTINGVFFNKTKIVDNYLTPVIIPNPIPKPEIKTDSVKVEVKEVLDTVTNTKEFVSYTRILMKYNGFVDVWYNYPSGVFRYTTRDCDLPTIEIPKLKVVPYVSLGQKAKYLFIGGAVALTTAGIVLIYLDYKYNIINTPITTSRNNLINIKFEF